MKHIIIQITCKGDQLSAITEAHNISKLIKEPLTLTMPQGHILLIKPDSNVLDLVEINRLTIDLERVKNQGRAA